MIAIGIAITTQFKLLSVAAILDVLETVNRFYRETNQPVPFHISLYHLGDSQQTNDSLFYGYKLQSIRTKITPDLILIPSFTTDNIQQTIQNNKAFIPWLNKQFSKGASIASFCTGAFLLGASGLLNGRLATTHVDACKRFSQAFPEVKLQPDKTVTEDGGIYTSGGATSSFHLLLHLVQKYCGKEMTIRTAKVFAIDLDRHHQTYFSSFQPVRDHNDELVASAQQKIETSYQENGSIESIIKDIPSSRRNMLRRFKLVTGVTPIEYLQFTRIEAAKKLLEQTTQQMTEVIFNTGYNDPKAFRKVFRKTVGMTPSEYREKFQVR